MYIDFKVLQSYIEKEDINSIIGFYKSCILDYISRSRYLELDTFVKKTNRKIYKALLRKSIIILANKLTKGYFLYFIYFCIPIFYNDKITGAFTTKFTPQINREIRKRFLLKCIGLSNRDGEMRKIKALKNIHQGERCFIVCTGPSLCISDLNKLNGEFTFGVNAVIDAYSKTPWRPTYYVVQDYTFNKIIKYPVYGGRFALKNAFFSALVNPKTRSKDDIFFLLNYKNNSPLRKGAELLKASRDISVCIHDCGTVTNAAIQIALYMGFKKIYLIGADCNYLGKMYFNQKESKKSRETIEYLKQMTIHHIAGYKRMKKLAKKSHATIYNATRGGKLEVFERVNFDNLLR